MAICLGPDNLFCGKLIDLSTKILNLMLIDETKSLVKTLSYKRGQSNQKIGSLESENIELKNRLLDLIGEQELPEFK